MQAQFVFIMYILHHALAVDSSALLLERPGATGAHGKVNFSTLREEDIIYEWPHTVCKT